VEYHARSSLELRASHVAPDTGNHAERGGAEECVTNSCSALARKLLVITLSRSQLTAVVYGCGEAEVYC
jgi:hypothetical protein